MQNILPLLQILFGFWPVAFAIGVFIFFRGHGGWMAKARRGLFALFILWLVMGVIALILIFNRTPTELILPEPWNMVCFLVTGLVCGGPTIGLYIHDQLHIRRAFDGAAELKDLQSLDPEEFEQIMGEFFRRRGNRVRHVGRTGDHGLDLEIFTPDGEKWIAQCKRYKGMVGEPAVRDFYGTMMHENANRGFVITTGSFTSQARAWTSGKPITLLDGRMLVKLVKDVQKKRPESRE